MLDVQRTQAITVIDGCMESILNISIEGKDIEIAKQTVSQNENI